MRLLKRIFVGFLALIILLVVEPATWHLRKRREAISMLTAAKTTDELQQAVGGLGMFVPLRDGPWIAIRYRDTHGVRLESISLARDSGGIWYESNYHFCGKFRGYQYESHSLERIRTVLADLGETDTSITDDPRPEIYVTLDAVFEAESLEIDQQQLLKLGFEPLRK